MNSQSLSSLVDFSVASGASPDSVAQISDVKIVVFFWFSCLCTEVRERGDIEQFSINLSFLCVESSSYFLDALGYKQFNFAFQEKQSFVAR